MLGARDPCLYFLQRLRDEAHRFAISTHRSGRTKSRLRSSLDEISGIGAKRKRALLHHFGSAQAVARAGLADLEAVAGISRVVARRIYDHFHGTSVTAGMAHHRKVPRVAPGEVGDDSERPWTAMPQNRDIGKRRFCGMAAEDP